MSLKFNFSTSPSHFRLHSTSLSANRVSAPTRMCCLTTYYILCKWRIILVCVKNLSCPTFLIFLYIVVFLSIYHEFSIDFFLFILVCLNVHESSNYCSYNNNLGARSPFLFFYFLFCWCCLAIICFVIVVTFLLFSEHIKKRKKC